MFGVEIIKCYIPVIRIVPWNLIFWRCYDSIVWIILNLVICIAFCMSLPFTRTCIHISIRSIKWKCLQYLWGGFSVNERTLGLYFTIHYLLPHYILAIVVLHLSRLHDGGSSNIVGFIPLSDKHIFYPYYLQVKSFRSSGIS